jgi:hypothetical protein
MNQNTALPLVSISLFFRSSPAHGYRVQSWLSNEANLVIKSHPDVHHTGIYIQLSHTQLNTQLDLGGIAPAVILQFDEQQQFTGASLSLGTAAGSFALVTQSKRLLILPFDEDFPIGHLSHFELN